MKRPDYLFAGEGWAVHAHPDSGGRLEDGTKLRLFTDLVETAPTSYETELARGIWSWLMARGTRSVIWNGQELKHNPDFFDYCVPDAPKRVISVCPSNTEWLNLLGLQDIVIGLDSSSPFEADVPRLGRELTLDMDQLIRLKPDLVLASLSVPGMEKVVCDLFRYQIPHIVLAPQTLEEVRHDCLKMARLFGVQSRANSFLKKWDEAFGFSRVTKSFVPTYIEWWPKPLFSPAERCWTNQLLEMAGAQNIFRNEPGQSVEVLPEEVLRRSPELAIVSWCGVPHQKLTAEKLKKHPTLCEVPAVRNDHVYLVNEDFLGRPGPGLLEGLKEIQSCVEKVLGTS